MNILIIPFDFNPIIFTIIYGDTIHFCEGIQESEFQDFRDIFTSGKEKLFIRMICYKKL